MAIGERGQIAGSISGGCVESSVIDEGMRIAPGDPPKLLHYETSDDRAWEVGLPCGGSIDVLLEPLDPAQLAFLRRCLDANVCAYSVTIIGGDSQPLGKKISFDLSGASIGSDGGMLDRRLVELARSSSETKRVRAEGAIELFVERFSPAPTLVVVGGVHIALALVRMVRALGYLTAVVDPRKSFGSPVRFPDVDRLLPEWPQEAFEKIHLTADCAVVVLTHDPKLDDPALEAALRSPVFYIGALGSHRTQERRRLRLERLGFTPAELARIHGPAGLDIEASTPAEIALAIAAEMVALRHKARSVLRHSDFALPVSG